LDNNDLKCNNLFDLYYEVLEPIHLELLLDDLIQRMELHLPEQTMLKLVQNQIIS
jgi:hypothetical protein